MVSKFFIVLSLIFTITGCSTLQQKTSSTPLDKKIIAKNQSFTPNIPFNPTFISKEIDTYIDAIEIYDSSSQHLQGLYHYQNLVFVIISIDTKKEDIQYLEGTAMLRTKVLLKQHYPNLPTSYRLRNKIVEKTLDDDTGIYRYATVYRKKDIEKLLQK